MKYRTRLLAPLAAVLLAAGAGTVQAQDKAELAAIQQAGVIRIGTEGTYAPFSFHDAAGKLVFPGFIDPHTHLDLTTGTCHTAETEDKFFCGI